jgi:hypothetical protein
MELEGRQARGRISAYMLFCIYVIFVLSLDLHHFFAPEHDHWPPRVQSRTDGSSFLLSAEVESIDCILCQLAPMPATLPRQALAVLGINISVAEAPAFGVYSCFSALAAGNSRSRAPPRHRN